MRLAELHAQLQGFNQMIQPYFHTPKIDAELPHHLPLMHTGHKFEAALDGVTLDMYYVSKWDGLECEEVLLYSSIKAQIEGADLYQFFSDETQRKLERMVECDFARSQGWGDEQ